MTREELMCQRLFEGKLVDCTLDEFVAWANERTEIFSDGKSAIVKLSLRVIADLRARLARAEHDVDALKRLVSDLTAAIDRYQATIARLTAEHEALKHEVRQRYDGITSTADDYDEGHKDAFGHVLALLESMPAAVPPMENS